MKILCIGYRDWALQIYKKLSSLDNIKILSFKIKSEIDEDIIKKFKPDYILCYGWSWKISDYLVNNFNTLMFKKYDRPTLMP